MCLPTNKSVCEWSPRNNFFPLSLLNKLLFNCRGNKSERRLVTAPQSLPGGRGNSTSTDWKRHVKKNQQKTKRGAPWDFHGNRKSFRQPWSVLIQNVTLKIKTSPAGLGIGQKLKCSEALFDPPLDCFFFLFHGWRISKHGRSFLQPEKKEAARKQKRHSRSQCSAWLLSRLIFFFTSSPVWPEERWRQLIIIITILFANKNYKQSIIFHF